MRIKVFAYAKKSLYEKNTLLQDIVIVWSKRFIIYQWKEIYSLRNEVYYSKNNKKKIEIRINILVRSFSFIDVHCYILCFLKKIVI